MFRLEDGPLKPTSKSALRRAEMLSNSLPDGTHELSKYEVERDPIALIKDDTTITLNTKKLLQEFTCPICLSILQETHSVKECFHRFCGSCITKSIAATRECPTCRVKCTSKRVLRADPNFDKMISRLIPDIEAFETEEVERLKEVIQGHNMSALQNSFEQGIQRQKVMGKKKTTTSTIGLPATKRKSAQVQGNTYLSKPSSLRPTPVPTTTSTTAKAATGNKRRKMDTGDSEPQRTAATTAVAAAVTAVAAAAAVNEGVYYCDHVSYGTDGSKAAKPEVIQFRLQPHKEELKVIPLRREYISTSRNTTIEVVRRFLAEKYAVSDPGLFNVYIPLPTRVDPESRKGRPRFCLLKDEQTLNDVESRFGPRGSALLIYYAKHSTPINNAVS
eukprot:TRINITY_DN1834_c0_g1_i1.p1 TRINITY_DN1834_c0_g1~~TRINITY_DN1834_c0_g1_i1.p1  ORF type:complete len:399 (+),score=68.83 TRINITY_DN1834_c0_g1_i1:33-1199(+)